MPRLGIVTSNISADFVTPLGVPAREERQGPYAQVLRAAMPDRNNERGNADERTQ